VQTVGRGTAFICRSTQQNLRSDSNLWPVVALAAGALLALPPLQRPSDGG
jgi:hypothetical protein